MSRRNVSKKTLIKREPSINGKQITENIRVKGCPKPKVIQPKCHNKRIIHTTVKFILLKEICIPKSIISDRTPVCRSTRPLVKGQCQRFANGKLICQATDIKEIREMNNNCKCVTRLLKLQRTCCCPGSQYHTTCNRISGILTNTTITFKLQNRRGKFTCVRNVRKISKKIDSSINHNTISEKCQQNCLENYKIFRTNRNGCKRQTKLVRNDTRICCCRPNTRFVQECQLNILITKKYDIVLQNNKCVKVLKCQIEKRTLCPLVNVTQSACKLRSTIETTVSYQIKNCKCLPRKTSQAKPCKCLYKEYKTMFTKCDMSTCERRKIIYFKNNNCQYARKECPDKCCCPSSTNKTRCDHTTGKTLITIKSFKLDNSISRCTCQKTTLTHTAKCKQPRIIQHKCNEERKYYQKIVTIKEVLSVNSCKCQSISTAAWICCQLPPSITKHHCRVDYIQKEIINFQFNHDKTMFIQLKIIENVKVHCPPIKVPKRIENISNCQIRELTFYNKIENCTCKLYNKSEIYFKCCRDPIVKTQCVNSSEITTVTGFILRHDKKKCIPTVRKNVKAITCPKYIQLVKTKCENRIYYEITNHFEVRNCSCKIIKTVKVKKICQCDSAKNYTKCFAKFKRIIKKKYTLVNNEKCVLTTCFEDVVNDCQKPKTIISNCNNKTHHRTITRIHYDYKNCTCEKVERKMSIQCSCPKKGDEIKANICRKDNRRTVHIYRYLFRNSTCLWHLFKIYEEDCRCPAEKTTKECVADVITRMTAINFQLKSLYNQFPSHKCVESKTVTDKRLECNPEYTYREPCKNHIEQTIQCRFEGIKCQCVQSCQVIKITPCDCQKKNKSWIQCIRNVNYRIILRYNPSKTQCEESRSEEPINEQCKNTTNTKCYPEIIRKNHGCYLECKITSFVYRNCRCVQIIKRKFMLQSCCDKPTEYNLCVNNRLFLRTITFFKQGNKCILKKNEVMLRKKCPRHSISKIDETRNSIKYKLTHYVIENCTCALKCIVRYIPKCSPKISFEQCRNNTLEHHITEFKLEISDQKLFPEVNDQLRVRYCREHKLTWSSLIKCQRLNFRVTICNKATNQLRIEHHNFVVENCKCNEKTIVTHESCKKCANETIVKSACGPRDGPNGRRYLNLTKTTWRITNNNECRPNVITSKEVCECEPTKKTEECKNGKRIFKTIRYDLKQQCKLTTDIKSNSIYCYNYGVENKWILSKTVNCFTPGQFTVKHFQRYNFDSKKCVCNKVTKTEKVNVCCKPCQFKTECRNNTIVETNICQVSKNLTCENVNKVNLRSKICPNTYKELVGDCKEPFITYRLISYKSVNCQCHKTERIYTESKKKQTKICQNNQWNITEFHYEIIQGMCVLKRPITFIESIFCTKQINPVDESIDNCTFTRSHYVYNNLQCQCVKTLSRKETLHYKCCQEITKSEICQNHRTRVITTTNFKLIQFKCYRDKSVRKIPILCQTETKRERNQTGLCTFDLIHSVMDYFNCTCKKRVTSVERDLRLCCDGKNETIDKECDVKRGRIITKVTTIKLEGYRCITSIRNSSVPVNCDARRCKQDRSACNNHTQKIKIFCDQRKGCKCVKAEVKQHTVCCGSFSNTTWTRRRPCGVDRKHYQLIQTFTLKLNPTINKCQVVVIQKQYAICSCPPPFSYTTCHNDIYKRTVNTTFVINFRKNVFEKTLSFVRTLISKCSKNHTAMISERLIGKSGWCNRTYLTTFPKNCQCQHIQETRREICDCCAAFGCHHKHDHCENNNVLVSTSKEPRCSITSVIWNITITFTPKLNCNRTIKQINQCYNVTSKYSTQKRKIIHIRNFVENCTCRTRVIKEEEEDCECRKPHTSEECLLSKRVISSFSYSIVHGQCKQHKRVQEIVVPCSLTPKIWNSKCEDKKFIQWTKIFFLKNCQCESLVTNRTCDCQCPKDSKVQTCSGDYLFNVTTTKYHKQYCTCQKSSSVKQIEPNCPKFIEKSIGKCLPEHHGNYQLITTSKLRKRYDRCECVVVKSTKKKICGCKLAQKTVQYCQSNSNVSETWGWTINEKENRCQKILISKNIASIKCPKSTDITVWNTTTSRCVQTIVDYRLDGCNCFKFVTINRKCFCDGTPKLIKQGNCTGLPTCLQSDRYKHWEIRGNKCIPVIKMKPLICCCPPKMNVTLCQGNKFHHVNIQFRLINDICLKRISERTEIVNCSNKVDKKIGICQNNGYQLISYYTYKLRNCECLWRKVRDELCICKCKPNRTSVHCDEKLKSLIKIKYQYVISNCKCEEKKEIKKIDIKCPPPKIESICKQVEGRNYSINTTTITEFQIGSNDTNCECRRIVSITKTICGCLPLAMETNSCDKIKHVEIIENAHTIFKDGKCIRIIRKKLNPIKCNGKWEFQRSLACQTNGLYGNQKRIFRKFVNHECQCKEVTKLEDCDCLCYGPPTSKHCQNNTIHYYKYKYFLRSCRCQRLSILEKTEIKMCEKLPPKRGNCQIENNTCVSYTEYQDTFSSNCMCHTALRRERTPCATCSCPTSTVRKCDNSSNNVIISITRCEVLSNGIIKKSKEKKTVGVPCETEQRCKRISNCNPKTLTAIFVCIKGRIKDCQCVMERWNKTQICGCKRDSRTVDNCDRTTCQRKITIQTYKLVFLKNGTKHCAKELSISHEKCCCPSNPKQQVKCINNRLINKKFTYMFDEEKKTCDLTNKSNDETPICDGKIIKKPALCNKTTCDLSVKITTHNLVDCQCRAMEKIVKTKCCCPKDFANSTCIDYGSEITNHKFTLTDGRCIETICKKQKLIECPHSKIEDLKCNQLTGIKIRRKITYVLKNCQCIKTVKDINEKCDCSKVSKISQTCLSKEGIYRIVEESQEYNDDEKKCVVRTNTKDKKISCIKEPKAVLSQCLHRHGHGTYSMKTTTFEIQNGCNCEQKTETKYQLCYCNAYYAVRECHNNVPVKRKISYERKISKGLYDYECVYQEKLVKGPPLICPNPTTDYNSCSEEYFSTYYKNKNCACEKITNATTTGECETKYCNEVPNNSQCAAIKNATDCDETIAFSCPITCKQCVKCDTNHEDCERNDYEGGITVWARVVPIN